MELRRHRARDGAGDARAGGASAAGVAAEMRAILAEDSRWFGENLPAAVAVRDRETGALAWEWRKTIDVGGFRVRYQYPIPLAISGQASVIAYCEGREISSRSVTAGDPQRHEATRAACNDVSTVAARIRAWEHFRRRLGSDWLRLPWEDDWE